MSSLILLNSILEQYKSNYPSGLTDDELFELYCADNILTNYDLNVSELESGQVDGPKDAGIDCAYLFINRNLVSEDFDFSTIKQPVDIELILIQAKNQDSFKEGPIDKLSSSLPLLLDADRSPQTLQSVFKKEVVEICQTFLRSMKALAGQFPKLSVRIYYCSKGHAPNEAVAAKAAALENTLKQNYPAVSVNFLGAQELYERSGKQKRIVKELVTLGAPLSGRNSYVALSKLTDYLDFISDETGDLITRIFDANVRAYQGDVEVNREIGESLKSPTDGVDFWWLNNGVTIVADQAQFQNNRLVIENPLVVNGLQTSNEIHNNSEIISKDDSRMILVRVIVEHDREKRDEIIRATNRQTYVTHSSFRATESVHREIEDYLMTLGYFYDRRKNYYKREGKPSDRIIGIDRLAQAVLSVLSQEPHTARGRPTTAIKKDEDYKRLFSENRDTHPLAMFGNIVRLLDRVESWFRRNGSNIDRRYRNNVKFHVLMVLSWVINGSSTLPAQRLAQLDLSRATDENVDTAAKWVFGEFDTLGGEDKTAKDSELTERLQSNWSLSKT